MRSPIGGFSENDLARIRLAYDEYGDFIEAVRFYAFEHKPQLCRDRYSYMSGNLSDPIRKKYKRVLRAKCIDFIYKLRRWRSYVRTRSVARLIWAIYEETYFYDIMGAIEGGEEAQFNLRLLYERAKQFESSGFKGLFGFARYIERMESRGEDLGGAKLVGENHDVVRIMTIHKSKGLEFPYVFVLGCGKRFNRRKDVSTICLHKDLGIGMPYIRRKEHYMKDSVIKDLINEVNKNELTSEEMRLLYVALTRAREKLYVVVSTNAKVNDTPESLDEQWRDALTCGRMLPSNALAASGFSDWLCPAVYASPQTWKLVYHVMNGDEVEAEAKPEAVESYEDSIELKNSVYSILNYKYPYSESDMIPSRTSVTQLKELTIERMSSELLDEPVYEPDSRRISGADDMAELMFSPLHPRPSFLLEKGTKPANEIGTLYHLVMSEIDLERIKREGTKCVSDELQRMAASELITADDIGYIDKSKIAAFFDSDIGKRMLRSREVHRESPFQINIPANVYDPSLGSEYADETVILQGIIDCFFKENGSFILIDYKTDHVGKNKAVIKKKYAKQLELYSQAIETLTDSTVSRSLLYLFDTGEVI